MPGHPFRYSHEGRHHPTPSREALTTALPLAPSPPGDSYLGPAPSLEDLKHLAAQPGSGNHPAPSRPSRISTLVRRLVHVAESDYTDGPKLVRASLPASRSFLEERPRDFWGPKTEAPPYPSSCVFRGLASSPRQLTRKPSSQGVGPFTVELFTFGRLTRYPSAS